MTSPAILQTVKLDSDNDLDLSGGRLQMADDTEAIRVMLQTKLTARKGKYFLNLDFGLDYDVIEGKKGIDLELITEYKLAIIETQGVIEIVDFSADLDSKRKMAVTFEVKTIFTKEPISVTV